MEAGVAATPLTAALLAAAVSLLAAAWWLSRREPSALRESAEPVPTAAARAGGVGALVGAACFLVAAGTSLVFPGEGAAEAWAWLSRPETLLTVCIVALLVFPSGGSTRPWLLVGVALAAAAPWAASLLPLSLGSQPPPLAASLAAAVLTSLLLSPPRREQLVAQAHRVAALAAGDGLLVVDGRGQILDANGPAVQLLNLSEMPRAGGRGQTAPSALQQLLADPGSRRARLKTGAGRFLEARTTHRLVRGPLRDVRAVLLRDITDQYRDERRLVRLAHYDSLTGLANRRLFLERIRRTLEAARQSGNLAALMYLDLDRFKEINDSLGHAAGDVLLRTLAERLRDYFEEEDLASLGIRSEAQVEMARLAGDEFAIIVPCLADPGAASEVAERMLRIVSAPMELGSQRISNSASIGIALFPEDAGDVESLLSHADAALYVAKNRGRGRFAFYEPSFDEKADRKHKIEQGLREAVRLGELRLHYQPKVDIASSGVVGFEALLRWKSRELGDVGPREFIPVAEDRGLIAELGAWCLDETCRQLKEWRERGFALVPVSVNVSSSQFRQTNLLQVVSDALKRHGIDPHLLELELTESLLLEEGEETILALRDLRAFGTRVALDDFGTGYSALSYLNRFPIDSLKMDRSLLRDIESSPTAAGIASAVVAMAHTLGLSVVAEGVDSEGQLEPLREMSCDQIQGFLYAPALGAEEAERFLARSGERPPTIRPGADPPGRIRVRLASSAQLAGARGAEAGADAADADLPSERSAPDVLADADLPSVRSDPPVLSEAELPSFRESPPAPRPPQSDDADRRVLVLDDAAASLGPLALRLARLGVDVHYAANRDEARLFVKQERDAIRLLAVSPAVDLAQAEDVLELLTRQSGKPAPWIAIGEEPDAAVRSRMRQAGVTWVLWAPFDDNELCFVGKAAMSSPDHLSQRREPRVPVDLLAQVRVGARREVAMLSTLSSRGAFIEVSDPPPIGSQLRLEFDLPPERFRLFARVVHRQDEEPGAPLSAGGGIGVVFYGTQRDAELSLRKAVEERAARYLP